MSKYNIEIDIDNQWKQLEVLWNKEIEYNWYDITILRFQWEFYRKKENFNHSIEKFANESNIILNKGLSVSISIGLFGLVLTIYIDEEEINERV